MWSLSSISSPENKLPFLSPGDTSFGTAPRLPFPRDCSRASPSSSLQGAKEKGPRIVCTIGELRRIERVEGKWARGEGGEEATGVKTEIVGVSKPVSGLA